MGMLWPPKEISFQCFIITRKLPSKSNLKLFSCEFRPSFLVPSPAAAQKFILLYSSLYPFVEPSLFTILWLKGHISYQFILLRLSGLLIIPRQLNRN